MFDWIVSIHVTNLRELTCSPMVCYFTDDYHVDMESGIATPARSYSERSALLEGAHDAAERGDPYSEQHPRRTSVYDTELGSLNQFLLFF